MAKGRVGGAGPTWGRQPIAAAEALLRGRSRCSALSIGGSRKAAAAAAAAACAVWRWNSMPTPMPMLRRGRDGTGLPATATALNNLAYHLKLVGRGEQARLYEEALAARTMALGADHPDTIAPSTILQSCYWRWARKAPRRYSGKYWRRSSRRD